MTTVVAAGGGPAIPSDADIGRQLADALAGDDDAAEIACAAVDGSNDARGQGGAVTMDGGGVLATSSHCSGLMSAAAFLAHVMPPAGYVCITTPSPDGTGYWHDVRSDTAAAAARALALAPMRDVFFAPLTLKEEWVWDPSKNGGKGGKAWRIHANMAQGKCQFADIDVKPGEPDAYPTKAAARQGLADFLTLTGLPKPTAVASGGGLHLYWPWDRPLSSESWHAAAIAFHKLCIAAGFKVDPSRVSDRSSVLRVPGTFHRKDPANPRMVEVLHVGEATPVEVWLDMVEHALAKMTGADASSSRGSQTAAQAASVAAGSGTLSPFDFGPQAARDATPPPPETPENIAMVRGMLTAIGPNCSREVWRDAAFAALATGWACAADLLRDWSREGKDWNDDPELAEGQLEDFIRRYDPNRPGGIRFGSLVHLARKAAAAAAQPSQAGASAGGVATAAAGSAIGPAAAVGVAAAAIDEGGDVALGRLFAARHRGKLVYVPENEGWLGFDPLTGWWPDPFAAERAAKEVSDAMFADAVAKRRAGGLSDAERKKLFGFAERAARLPQQRAMIVEAMSEPGMSASAASFDADPMLLGHPGGVLDLNTGSPVVITPDTRVTKRCGVSFDPIATCPMWDRFIASIFPDAEKCAFVQRLAGYFLTGRTREQQFVFAQGGGQNGKSTFFEVLAFVLGDYAVKLATEMLMQSKLPRNPQGPSADVMALKGARLAFTGETEEGQRLATSRIKEWTGDGELSGRVPYAKRGVTFAITHKLVFVGNAKVAFPDTGHAMARRFIFLTFDVTIPPARKDAGLKSKLEREGPGILNWMLAGLRDYLAGGGLRVPAAMQDAARDYLKAEDTLGTFLADSFEAGSSFTVSKEALRHRHEEWCKENGHQPLGQTALTRKLNERGISYDRNTRTFKGIRVPPLVLPAGRA